MYRQIIYNGLLKMFDSFTENDVKFVYKFDEENSIKLRDEYQLLDICGKGTVLEKSVRLMEWLFSNLIHDPNYANQVSDNALCLLQKLKKTGNQL